MDSLTTIQNRTYDFATTATKGSWPFDRRMSAADLDAVLRRRMYAVVASTRRDGRPHVAPTGFVHAAGALWLPTVRGAVRSRNIARFPAVAVSLSEGEGDLHAWLLIEGPATEVRTAPEDVLAVYQAKYNQRAEWAACWHVVDPERVLSYRGEKWERP